jgi:rhamnulose-1-phosphate aldolase
LIFDIIKEISSVAGYLWEKDWAERNAGNLSVNVTEFVRIPDVKLFSFKLGMKISSLANRVLLVSSSGSRMRDMKDSPLNHLIFLVFDKEGGSFSKYKLNNRRHYYITEDIPSSELPVHLFIHGFITMKNPGLKSVLHTHPTELISLTHRKECAHEKRLNRILSSAHAEIRLFLPGGLGLIEEQESGNTRIAAETIKSLETHNLVLWKKHGVISVSDTVENAFDLVDIANKAAKIYLLAGQKTFSR